MALAITARLKHELEILSRSGSIRLPDSFKRPKPEGYARRLLHRDPDRGYSAVVMTWAPGQRTALHDHSGIWCVEGVVEGQMEVTRYDLVDEDQGAFRFEQKGHVLASVGSAGCLIPPFEYHILGNALADRPSITLHVYGGDMNIGRIRAAAGPDVVICLDAAQSVGHLPVSVAGLDVDFLVFSGHKAMALPGTGVIWAANRRGARFAPSHGRSLAGDVNRSPGLVIEG